MANKRTREEREAIHIFWERQGEPFPAYLHLYARIFADIMGNKKAQLIDPSDLINGQAAE